MAGLLSKNIKLSYKTTAAGTSYTEVDNLQEIPDLGAAPEQIDVTTLANNNKTYIPGLVDFGTLEFTFLYDNSSATSNFRVLKGLETAGTPVFWELEFPDALTEGTGTHHGTKFQFSGFANVATTGAGVNAALQFKLTITVNSDFTIVNPA